MGLYLVQARFLAWVYEPRHELVPSQQIDESGGRGSSPSVAVGWSNYFNDTTSFRQPSIGQLSFGQPNTEAVNWSSVDWSTSQLVNWVRKTSFRQLTITINKHKFPLILKWNNYSGKGLHPWKCSTLSMVLGIWKSCTDFEWEWTYLITHI